MLLLIECICFAQCFLADRCSSCARAELVSACHSMTVSKLSATQWLHIEYWILKENIPFRRKKKSSRMINGIILRLVDHRALFAFKDEKTEWEWDKCKSSVEVSEPTGETRWQQQERAMRRDKKEDYEQKPYGLFHFTSPGWKKKNLI